MTYLETIEFLFTRLPMFSKTGASAIKPDLVNTHRICEFLGNPEKKVKTIHVAGTNGKGSVCHMLASALQACGYKTGLYTSPHLRDFRERIRIDGEMIHENYVVEFTQRVIPLIEEIHPSFFEITVGMAFDYFHKQQVDIAVIETGLGGRLDSTNVITPDLSVITNISMDHMNILGNSVQEIAAEKAGIIKDGVPVIVGERSLDTEDVFISAADYHHSELLFADRLYYGENWRHKSHQLFTQIVNRYDGEHHDYLLDLPGYYQIKNLITVLASIDQLKRDGWVLPAQKVTRALSQVKKLTGLHGRWEQVHDKPPIITDVAHNEAGIIQLLEQLELTDHNEVHLVFGMVRDKEIEAILRLLPKKAHYYFTQAHIPRALPATDLRQKAKAAGLAGNNYPDVNIAVKDALARASEDDLILVFGSVYLVGELNF
ncbi:MAG TPA: folylpolyglutamate synthase/dihydrofolate synthase family protein [Flavitalea sp.]|nr:folylpolyglutamate synthase/dihydrofolate synthase family protein [Flavitalea sp.]